MKKVFFSITLVLMMIFYSSVCFAEGNTSINLGNEIKGSLDKAGKSMENVMSGNIVGSTVNSVTGGMYEKGSEKNSNENNNMYNMNNNRGSGNYNTIRTDVEGQISNFGMNTMTVTTWMWIILIAAALIIMAAIWYYATQSND